MQDIGGRSDWVAAQVKWAPTLLTCENQAPCCCLIAVDVYIDAWAHVFGFNAVFRYRGMYVVAIVVAALYHLGIGIEHGRFLGKFFFQKSQCACQWHVEKPANESQCKHVAAFHLRLKVHAAVLKGCFHHCGHWHFHNLGLEPYFLVRVIGCELGLFEVDVFERVDVDNRYTVFVQEFHVLLQGSRVHCHKHVALIAWCVHSMTYVNLKTTYTTERTLWGSDLGGIVGEGGDDVAHLGRYA